MYAIANTFRRKVWFGIILCLVSVTKQTILVFHANHQTYLIDCLVCCETKIGIKFDFQCTLVVNWSENKIFLAAYIYQVMYTFQSESTHYSCLNVKELLTQNRHSI